MKPLLIWSFCFLSVPFLQSLYVENPFLFPYILIVTILLPWSHYSLFSWVLVFLYFLAFLYFSGSFCLLQTLWQNKWNGSELDNFLCVNIQSRNYIYTFKSLLKIQNLPCNLNRERHNSELKRHEAHCCKLLYWNPNQT